MSRIGKRYSGAKSTNVYSRLRSELIQQTYLSAIGALGLMSFWSLDFSGSISRMPLEYFVLSIDTKYHEKSENMYTTTQSRTTR